MKLSHLNVLFCCMFLTSAMFGQGRLIGLVTDSLTNNELIGANVYLEGTALGTSTDSDGAYRIDGIPAGSYRLVVSYLGYQEKSKSIQVVDDETQTVNIPLIYDVVQGKEVTITAQAEGQVAAINQQINSKTIMNVVSEEKIQELPDANAAEAVGRLPGVAIERSGGEANKVVLRGLDPVFTTITIDGVRVPTTGVDERDVDLSTISQGSLAGIELHKAITSDMDGDGIAGSINFVTRKAPAKRTLKLDARGAYNGIEESYGQYVTSLKYSDRFMNDKVGVQLSGNLEQRIRSDEEYDPSYNFNAGGFAWLVNDIQLTYTDEVRKRNGVSALFDFDTPDGGNIKFSNVFSLTNRNYVTYERNYPIEDKEDLFYTIRDREQEIATFNTFLKGDNNFLGMVLDWNVAYASSRSKMPYDYTMNFHEPSLADPVTNQQISGMGDPSDDVRQTDPVNIIPFAYNNFERAYLYNAFFRGEDAKENEITAYLNFSKPYNLSHSLSGNLKFGGKYRSKSRERSFSEEVGAYYIMAFPQFVKTEDGSIVPKDFTGTRFENLQLAGSGLVLLTNFLEGVDDRDVFDKYQLYPLINVDAINEWYDLNKNGFDNITNDEYDVNREPDVLFYDIDERVSGAYVMNTLNIGQKFTLISGIRGEFEDNNYNSRYSPSTLSGFPVPAGIYNDTTAYHKETVWLPNFHLTYRPLNFLGIRLAAYRALQRPNFNDRLENYIARQAGTFYSGNSIILGNPDLKAAKAWNFEVNTSFFEGKYGLFSVSAFYKDIKDMIQVIDGLEFKGFDLLDSLEINYNIPNSFVTSGYNLRYPYNSDKPTKVWGFETEVQTSLRYMPGMPGFLRNIVLSGNLSIVRTETYVPQQILVTDTIFIGPIPIPQSRREFVESKVKLTGQPNYIGNFAVGYDYRGFSARLSTFYQAASNSSTTNDANSTTATFSQRIAFSRWDLSLKQRLNPMISFYLNLYNLTDTNEGSNVINPNRNFTLENYRQHYGISGDLGFQLTL